MVLNYTLYIENDFGKYSNKNFFDFNFLKFVYHPVYVKKQKLMHWYLFYSSLCESNKTNIIGKFFQFHAKCFCDFRTHNVVLNKDISIQKLQWKWKGGNIYGGQNGRTNKTYKYKN